MICQSAQRQQIFPDDEKGKQHEQQKGRTDHQNGLDPWPELVEQEGGSNLADNVCIVIWKITG